MSQSIAFNVVRPVLSMALMCYREQYRTNSCEKVRATINFARTIERLMDLSSIYGKIYQPQIGHEYTFTSAKMTPTTLKAVIFARTESSKFEFTSFRQGDTQHTKGAVFLHELRKSIDIESPIDTI